MQRHLAELRKRATSARNKGVAAAPVPKYEANVENE